ncbi:phosphatidylinositol N-acetylglucosaminyltransferase subunit H [Lithobates pipiens]
MESSVSGGVAMESSVFSDIVGQEIRLERRSYSDTCREFTIIRPKLSLRSLIGWTCCVWVIAYLLFLYTELSAVLSAAILVSLLGLLVHLHVFRVEEESLLVLGSLGLQRSSVFGSGRETSNFLEMWRIRDLLLTETVSGCAVHYGLCVLTGDGQLIPVFRGPQPRLDCLREIYRSVQEVLSRDRQCMSPR